jgi:hypothetical protein
LKTITRRAASQWALLHPKDTTPRGVPAHPRSGPVATTATQAHHTGVDALGTTLIVTGAVDTYYRFYHTPPHTPTDTWGIGYG